MNQSHQVKERLKRVERIVITDYARRRAAFRQIDLAEAAIELQNPINLAWAERQEEEGEERFNCYFTKSKRATLRLIIAFRDEKTITLINAIKIRTKWQKTLRRT